MQAAHGSLYRPGSSLETRWTVVPSNAKSALELLLEAAYQPAPEQQQVGSHALVVNASFWRGKYRYFSRPKLMPPFVI